MARPKYNPHPDKNQGEIVQALQDCGFLVVNVSRWCSIPDLFVWRWSERHQMNLWMAPEIKTEDGDLTETQEKLMAQYPGAYLLTREPEDVLREYGLIGG